MAVGKSGERANRDRMTVSVGGIDIAREGGRIEDYDEAPVAAHMKGQEIQLTVDTGRSRATVWTCDLTHGYISINADTEVDPLFTDRDPVCVSGHGGTTMRYSPTSRTGR